MRDVLALYRAVVARDPEGARAVYANTRDPMSLTMAAVEFGLRMASDGPGEYTGTTGCTPGYAFEVLRFIDRVQDATWPGSVS